LGGEVKRTILWGRTESTITSLTGGLLARTLPTTFLLVGVVGVAGTHPEDLTIDSSGTPSLLVRA